MLDNYALYDAIVVADAETHAVRPVARYRGRILVTVLNYTKILTRLMILLHSRPIVIALSVVCRVLCIAARRCTIGLQCIGLKKSRLDYAHSI